MFTHSLESICIAGLLTVLPLTATGICSTRPTAADEPGRVLVLQDDFDNRETPGDKYTLSSAGSDGWTIRDGVLTGKQVTDRHGAVIRRQLKFDDIDVGIDFRFSGGSRFNFVIDDKNEKSVHAGHICRVSISRRRITIGDDKLGAMNLKVRAQRQNAALPEDQKRELQSFLKTKQESAVLQLDDGRWYTLRIRIAGDLMTASIDGLKTVSLRSAGLDHPTKTQFGMTVTGETIDFDNLKVYSLTSGADASDSWQKP